MTDEKFESTDDKRTINNPPDEVAVSTKAADAMRMSYRVLSDEEKYQMAAAKMAGGKLWDFIDSLGDSAELTLAKRHVEDAVMRAVRHITE